MRAFITGKSSDYSLCLSWKLFQVTKKQLNLQVSQFGICISYNCVKGHTTFYKLLLLVEELCTLYAKKAYNIMCHSRKQISTITSVTILWAGECVLKQGLSTFMRPWPGKFFSYKTRAWYNWCQSPVPGHGPAVEKHWSKVPWVQFTHLCITVTELQSGDGCSHMLFCVYTGHRTSPWFQIYI
jgi:hypothetical protein